MVFDVNILIDLEQLSSRFVAVLAAHASAQRRALDFGQIAFAVAFQTVRLATIAAFDVSTLQLIIQVLECLGHLLLLDLFDLISNILV